MRIVLAALGVAILLAYAAPAAAQNATQADEEAAKAHFLAGSAYYEQANYADAVKEFNEAHRLSKRPDLLYNISVCYERLGHWDEAIAALQQYLTDRPAATDRAVIESRIKNFEARRDAEKAEEAATPPPVNAPPPTVPPARRRHVTSYILGGIGAGLLLGALGTGVAAHLTYSDLTDKCGGKICNGNDQTLRDERAFGKTLTISTDVLLGIGGAALVTGVILFIVEARKPAPRTVLRPSAGGLYVTF
jgi:tetratricopeptide (TPR) repeat protein